MFACGRVITVVMRTSRLASLIVTSAFALSLVPAPAFAEGASIVLEQKSPIETIGSWTLIYPSNEKMERSNDRVSIDALPPGRYTLIVRPPEGMTTMIELLRGNEVVQTVDHPQITFQAQDGDAFALTITYEVSEGGTVGVNSDPSGIKFELTGPDNLKRTGTTPTFYENLPQGNYSVKYQPTGCPLPPAVSARMDKEKRADFSIRIVCDTLELENGRGDAEIVHVDINGESVAFTDVPVDEWFAPYVETVARREIITGYKDADGRFTGLFGPGNPVTLAELSKIAHEMGTANEQAATQSTMHAAAKGTWFEKYFASAEERGWTIYLDPELDPHRPATRAEVVVTLLQVIDVPMQWPKGGVFGDVRPSTRYSGAIETAADIGIIEGTGNGSLKNFNPASPINRAEISKILIEIQEKFQQKYDRDDYMDPSH